MTTPLKYVTYTLIGFLAVVGVLYTNNGFSRKFYLDFFLKSKNISKDEYIKYLSVKDSASCTMTDIFAPAIGRKFKSKEDKLGMIMCAEDDYKGIFGPVVNKLILKYHNIEDGFKHISDFDVSRISDLKLDAEGKYIISTRIRFARNLANHPFRKVHNIESTANTEAVITSILSKMEDDLKGEYHPISKMSKEQQKSLIEEHLLFEDMSKSQLMKSSGIVKSFTPKHSGIYLSEDKKLAVWVNEEDHIRIISIETGGDVRSVFRRLVRATEVIEKEATFAYSDVFGYLASCPSNIGTGMRASVMIKLPNLSKNMKKLKSLAEHYHLQIRSIHGENHKPEGSDTFDISNMIRLGRTEASLINELIEGLDIMIKLEMQEEQAKN